MSKRWTEREDTFIHAYFDTIGDYIGPHDLGRPKGAAAKRAKFLKETGAWDALTRMQAAHHTYLKLTGHRFADGVDEMYAEEPFAFVPGEAWETTSHQPTQGEAS
jgi:hypothetical protein